MLKWIDIIKFTHNGNPEPDLTIIKIDDEWKGMCTDEQFSIVSSKEIGRVPPSEIFSGFEPGNYACACCGLVLFESEQAFEATTVYTYFSQPHSDNSIAYHKTTDSSAVKVEALCNTCKAHIGYVFPDGPKPSGLRYSISSLCLKKEQTTERKVTIGGDCFWCTHAIFKMVKGVSKVESGYSGGRIPNPTYREVCSGLTGHAEVIEVTYDSLQISFTDLLRIHFGTHNSNAAVSTSANADAQYRSIIFYRNDEEKQDALRVVSDAKELLNSEVATHVEPFVQFYKAESYHQDYYANNANETYCQAVIVPKIARFTEVFRNNIKAQD